MYQNPEKWYGFLRREPYHLKKWYGFGQASWIGSGVRATEYFWGSWHSLLS